MHAGRVNTNSNSAKVKVTKKSNSVKTTSKSSSVSALSTTLKPGEDKILQAMGKLHAVGMTEPSRDQVQTFSGNGKTPEGFKKSVGKLKKAGYIVYANKDTMALTDEGIKHVGYVDPSSISLTQFHNNIKEILPSKQAVEIFDLLTDGEVHRKDELIDRLNLDRNKLSGLEKNLSKMKTLGFLDKTKDTVQLTAKCFPVRN